jgi:hypothetical protein
MSLLPGEMTYKATIEGAGLLPAPGFTDEGENYYYHAIEAAADGRRGLRIVGGDAAQAPRPASS